MPPQAQALADHPPFLTEDKTSQDMAGSHSKVKCVLVGDGAIGKTSLVVSYTTNGYPTEYVPTAFDNYSVVVTIDQNPVRLQLCDTAGQDDFDSLRPLCYPQTDVFLLCFSVVSPTSFHNILDKWLPEIRRHSPHAPIILVGTQSDLRNDVKVMIELARYNERPVTELEAKQRAEDMAALCYIECSALTQKNMKDVFDSALLAALDVNGNVKRRKSGSKRWKKGSKKSNSEEEMGSSKKSKHSDVRSPHTLSATSDVRKKTGWKRFCCML